jgi:metal-dependent amidase/aminoacylase/carboxypeptidase family protein
VTTGPISDAEVLAAVEASRQAIVETIRFVHDHPELAHEEHACAGRLATTLEGAGLEVERGVAGMATAFVATLRGSAPGRAVGIAALYDAVAAVRPEGSIEAVHSCGHGPIAGGVTGAALALATLRDRLPGAVAVVGCPADEIHAPGSRARGGGKLLSAAGGIWDGFDAALYAHPEFVDTVSLASRVMRRERVRVSGSRSLTAVPEPPTAAARTLIDAAEPDVMIETLALEGDVEEATGLVLRAEVLVFADEEDELERRCAALRARLPDGAWTSGPTVLGVRTDPAVRDAVREAFAAAGRGFVEDPPPLPFATDFGNVSRRAAAALIGVGREGGWRFHEDEGAREFASPDGEEAAMTIARVMALAALRLTRPAAGA